MNLKGIKHIGRKEEKFSTDEKFENFLKRNISIEFLKKQYQNLKQKTLCSQDQADEILVNIGLKDEDGFYDNLINDFIIKLAEDESKLLALNQFLQDAINTPDNELKQLIVESNAAINNEEAKGYLRKMEDAETKIVSLKTQIDQQRNKFKPKIEGVDGSSCIYDQYTVDDNIKTSLEGQVEMLKKRIKSKKDELLTEEKKVSIFQDRGKIKTLQEEIETFEEKLKECNDELSLRNEYYELLNIIEIQKDISKDAVNDYNKNHKVKIDKARKDRERYLQYLLNRDAALANLKKFADAVNEYGKNLKKNRNNAQIEKEDKEYNALDRDEKDALNATFNILRLATQALSDAEIFNLRTGNVVIGNFFNEMSKDNASVTKDKIRDNKIEFFQNLKKYKNLLKNKSFDTSFTKNVKNAAFRKAFDGKNEYFKDEELSLNTAINGIVNCNEINIRDFFISDGMNSTLDQKALDFYYQMENGGFSVYYQEDGLRRLNSITDEQLLNKISCNSPHNASGESSVELKNIGNTFYIVVDEKFFYKIDCINYALSNPNSVSRQSIDFANKVLDELVKNENVKKFLKAKNLSEAEGKELLKLKIKDIFKRDDVASLLNKRNILFNDDDELIVKVNASNPENSKVNFLNISSLMSEVVEPKKQIGTLLYDPAVVVVFDHNTQSYKVYGEEIRDEKQISKIKSTNINGKDIFYNEEKTLILDKDNTTNSVKTLIDNVVKKSFQFKIAPGVDTVKLKNSKLALNANNEVIISNESVPGEFKKNSFIVQDDKLIMNGNLIKRCFDDVSYNQWYTSDKNRNSVLQISPSKTVINPPKPKQQLPVW